MSRLPPFIALRALEAAVRHRSYSRAADELAVTHGAVSQQIRRLEEEFDVRLFLRQGNLMEPTDAALKLASHVTGAIASLQDGVAGLRALAQDTPLVLSTVPAFASRWLIPRLGCLPEGVGELQLRVEERIADMVSDGVDAGLRHGRGPWPGLEAAALFPDALFPVCSPAFLQRFPVRTPEDLRHVPLLRHTIWRWSLWFQLMRLEPPEQVSSLIFDDSSLLIDGAVQGLGVALARSGLVDNEITAGRLVRPLPGQIDAESSYHFVWRDDSPKLGRILRLRDWLLEEARRTHTRG